MPGRVFDRFRDGSGIAQLSPVCGAPAKVKRDTSPVSVSSSALGGVLAMPVGADIAIVPTRRHALDFYVPSHV